MLRARLLPPLPSSNAPLRQRSLEVARRPGITVVDAPRRDLVVPHLVRVLDVAPDGTGVAWCRLDPLDADAGHLAMSIAACTTALIRNDGDADIGHGGPAPPPAGERLHDVGAALGQRVPPGSTLVAENVPGLRDIGALLDLLGGWCSGPGHHRAVVLWYRRAGGRTRRRVPTVTRRALTAAPPNAAVRLAAAGLRPPTVERVVQAARGHAGVLQAMIGLAESDRCDVVVAATGGRGWRRDILTASCRALLASCEPDQRESLAVAARFGHWHPSLVADATAGDDAGWRALLTPLADGWFALSPVWASALQRALRRPPAAGHRPFPRLPDVCLAPSPRSSSVPTAPAAAEAPMATSCPASVERDDAIADADRAPDPEPPPEAAPYRGSGHTLTVRLFGALSVELDGHPVETWGGTRVAMIFRYLLVHRDRPCPRDVLLEVFWPGVHPTVAKNRLHVALSAARRSLRAAADVPVIEYEHGAYFLDPALDLDLDVDEFRIAAEKGRAAEGAGESVAAIEHYRRSVALYRGDLLADAPYEDWALLPRETCRVRYLDVLDSLMALFHASDRLAECIATAQLILQQDSCREDAHRVVMRCYARQGRVHQAIRQFEICTRSLDSVLGLPPSAATVDLYRTIRRDGGAR